MSSLPPSDELLLSGSDDFLYRIMEDYKSVIRHVANRFRNLDPMYDTDDLLQEAFFGVRSACNSWVHARAIQMQFKTYLTWHISRHFQSQFHGDDKVVDILDKHGAVRVSIPWSKYKKTGRAAAKARGFTTRVRSLNVYYEDPNHQIDVDNTKSEWCPIHSGDDIVVDVFDGTGALVVTIPRRNYLRVQTVIQQQGYTVREYSIYDQPPAVPQIPTPLNALFATQSLTSEEPSEDDRSVVDLYTKREVFLTRIPMTRYRQFKAYISQFGLKTRIQNPTLVPEPLDYDDEPNCSPMDGTYSSAASVR